MIALVAKPKKPVPEKLLPGERSVRSPEYEALCKKLGVNFGHALLPGEVVSFMEAEGMPTYSFGSVERFMNHLSVSAKKAWRWAPLREDEDTTIAEDGYVYVLGIPTYAPIVAAIIGTAATVATALLHGTRMADIGFGGFMITVVITCVLFGFSYDSRRYVGYTDTRSHYARAVPIEHLKNVQKLAEKFPELAFFVSDYEVPDPDPFIMCTTHEGWRIVFGMWDEPGYGEP